MLVEEFGVDADDSWRQHLADGREHWRRVQTCAAVRDAPGEAVAVLRDSATASSRRPTAQHPTTRTGFGRSDGTARDA